MKKKKGKDIYVLPCLHTYFYSLSSSIVSIKKLTGLNPSLHEIIADLGFFIQPS